MQLGYFPSYIVLFAAGCIAARHRWLARIDWTYARPWWIVSLATLPILPVAALGYRALTHEPVQVAGGFNFGALLYAFWEPFLAWGVLLTLLWYFRTRVRAERFRRLARRAYAIYCFHPPVVVAFSVALRSWDAPAALKFVVVGTLSCAALFLLTGWLLRIRLLARIW
jgi:surface polysaccharide O-acyltransferase-like enzyme